MQDVGRSAPRHHLAQFISVHGEDTPHAKLSVDCQPPDKGATNEHRPRSECDGLQDVSPLTHSAVEINFQLASSYGLDDTRQGLECCSCVGHLVTAVVRHDQTGSADLDTHSCVLSVLYSFDD